MSFAEDADYVVFDETINVWGRFTFILPFAAGMLVLEETRKLIVRRLSRQRGPASG